MFGIRLQPKMLILVHPLDSVSQREEDVWKYIWIITEQHVHSHWKCARAFWTNINCFTTFWAVRCLQLAQIWTRNFSRSQSICGCHSRNFKTKQSWTSIVADFEFCTTYIDNNPACTSNNALNTQMSSKTDPFFNYL